MVYSNKFGQMQVLTNDNYSDLKLYSIFHIENKAIDFITNKKGTNNTRLHSSAAILNILIRSSKSRATDRQCPC